MKDRTTCSPANRGQVALRGEVTEDTHVNSLILSTELRDTIVQYLQQCLPHEGVGVLATHQITPFADRGSLLPRPEYGSIASAIYNGSGRRLDRAGRDEA